MKTFLSRWAAVIAFCSVAFWSPEPSSAWANQKKKASKKTAKSVVTTTVKAESAPIEVEPVTGKTANKSRGSAVAKNVGTPAINDASDRGTEAAVPVLPPAETAVPEVKGLDAQMVDALAPAPVSESVAAEPPSAGTFPPKSDYIGSQESQRSSETTVAPDQGTAQKLIRIGNTSPAPEEDPWERMAVPTLGVIAAMVLLALLWKFAFARGGGLFASQDKLRLLGQQMIGPRSKILIVEALGKKYLIGATNERVSLLADLDFYGDEESDAFPSFSARAQTRRSEPAPTASGGIPEPARDAEDTAEKIKERLKSLKKISK